MDIDGHKLVEDGGYCASLMTPLFRTHTSGESHFASNLLTLTQVLETHHCIL
jgi:hypothetical protein